MDNRAEIPEIMTPEDRARLDAGLGGGVPGIDNVVAETPEARRERDEKGLVGEEESRASYETKVTLLKLTGGVATTAVFLGLSYALVGKSLRDNVSTEFRVDNKSHEFVWLFDKDSPNFKGGVSILNILEQSRVAGVVYNDRETWGYRHLPGDLLEGGNSFGEKARILVGWSETLLSSKERGKLISKSKEIHQGETGVVRFDQRMNREELALGRSLTWEETSNILHNEFGFDAKYLNILTELRKEYFTGNGDLNNAILNAKKTAEEIQREETTTPHVAQNLLRISGLDRVVDSENLVDVAGLIPHDMTVAQAIEGVREMFPLVEIEKPPLGPATGSQLMMAITLGYLTRESPPLFNWARRQLQNLARRVPAISEILLNHKKA